MRIVKFQERLIKRIKRGTVSRMVYDATYEDGSVVTYFMIDTRVLHAGQVDFLGAPVYCHPCRDYKAHMYFQEEREARCLSCNNVCGENDTRPFAKVLAFPDMKRSQERSDDAAE